MGIVSVALERYFTRVFDPSKKLAAEQIEKLETLLQFGPSGTNSQPWRFIIVGTNEGKACMAKSAAGDFVFNERKMLDVSHAVVSCAKAAMDDAWLERVVDQEESDGCFAMPEARAANHRGRTFFADAHRKGLKDDSHWMVRQICLNVGNFLLGATAMGLDAVSIKDSDSAAVGVEFGPKEKGFTNVVVVPVGHHNAEDFNVALPKPRLPPEAMLTEV